MLLFPTHFLHVLIILLSTSRSASLPSFGERKMAYIAKFFPTCVTKTWKTMVINLIFVIYVYTGDQTMLDVINMVGAARRIITRSVTRSFRDSKNLELRDSTLCPLQFLAEHFTRIHTPQESTQVKTRFHTQTIQTITTC